MYFVFKVGLFFSGLIALLAVLLIVIEKGDEDIVTHYAEPMDLLKKISRNVLLNYASKEEVAFETLWQERACVVTFLRRFGWSLCRLGAKELSDIKPLLDEHNVRLIGVGLEEFGVEEFVAGKFFDGELFLDTQKKSYEAMGFKRIGFLASIPELLKKLTRDASARADARGITGNLSGDGMLTGGTIVVSKGGSEVMYLYKQQSFADHASNEEILKALGIESKTDEPKQDA